MSGPGLLADLATMMATSPEDVATRALELLLARSPAASSAMNRLLDEWRGHTTDTPVTRWASQVVAVDRSRTDLQGFTASGETAAIFENKFWAALTDNQPLAYLNRLILKGSLLVFVVPVSRVQLIAHEIAIRLGANGKAPPDEHWIGETVILSRESSPIVTVTSWGALLGTLSRAMEAASEYDNHADVRQLEALAARMETAGFRPFLQSELTGEVPRLLLRLSDLVDGTVQSMLLHPFANKKGLKASAGLGWYGHYIRVHGYGCQILVTAHRWAEHGISPLWLRISGSDWRFPAALGGPLRRAVANERWLFEEQGSWAGYWVALRVLENREREAVIADLEAQILRLAEVLGKHPERDTDKAPPDAG